MWISKRNTAAVIAAAVAVGAAVAGGIDFIGDGEQPADASAEWRDLSELYAGVPLKDGDLIFRRGRDAIAEAVLTYGEGTRFSHVGAVVIEGGSPHVIHAIPREGSSAGGVVIETLSAFGAPSAAADIAVYRLAGLETEHRRVIASYLHEQVGKPFDGLLLASEQGSHYCSELVVHALRAGGTAGVDHIPTIELGPIPEPVISPEALLALPGLAEVEPR